MLSPLSMPRVVVATHGHCFDGLCSAVMFTRLMRHLHPGQDLEFKYRGMGYGPGQNGVDPAVLAWSKGGPSRCAFRVGPAHTDDSGMRCARFSVWMSGCRTLA